MNGREEEPVFEVAIVVPKKREKEGDENRDCVEFLVQELKTAGLIVERVCGISDEFIKLAAPPETLGRAATELQIKKLTYIGMELQFEWDQVTAFVTQPDGSLFSWFERFRCFHHLIYRIVNRTEADLTLKFDGKEIRIQINESLLKRFEDEGIVKQVFPLHDEKKRKQLLKNWALNWLDFTSQPVDEIYLYYGTKIATYFSFLGMYTRWLFFPAALGLALQLIDFGFLLTAVYLLAIQYYTQIGGKMSVILINYENNQGEESSSASLVYKVFGLYFMQSYIGLFYHALLHRNLTTLREVLIQRLIVSQVLENLMENAYPYLKYSYKKYKAVHKKMHEQGSSGGKRIRLTTRVEKEYLKPSYTACIGKELEDGLFDDYLELALQFGMIMMFASAFPLVFCFAILNNITEIRTDALKLLVMLRRPVPRASATIGAWLNIFQFLIVTAICTNCILLVCLYDQEGKWRIEPGLAAILIMEHVLLLIKFGFSNFVPEEPAWVKANRVRNVVQVRDMYSKQLLRSISNLEKKRD
ncbi:anoctamin-like protein Os01g0706700 isoform X4 [Elaeis guineensis]|uniref:anoctamin-like protein Os01g0706700 isoform X4 n=1 Tax=Elaeis guineensis var. tenera TaxID=51953 RepID=UPI003C6D415D